MFPRKRFLVYISSGLIVGYISMRNRLLPIFGTTADQPCLEWSIACAWRSICTSSKGFTVSGTSAESICTSLGISEMISDPILCPSITTGTLRFRLLGEKKPRAECARTLIRLFPYLDWRILDIFSSESPVSLDNSVVKSSNCSLICLEKAPRFTWE